jgi:large subunit ribosomal protein L24
MAKRKEKLKPIHLKIKKGDIVEVIAGNDRGKRGKVLKVYPRVQKVIVESIKFMKKHTRATQTNPQGGIQTREALDITFWKTEQKSEYAGSVMKSWISSSVSIFKYI